jgi:hypothetical protein
MSRRLAVAEAAVVVAGALGVAALLPLGGGDGAPAAVGEVRFLRSATSAFDADVLAAEADPELQGFWHSNYWRMRGYAPFYERHTFDGNPPWTPPPTHFYRDLYAIYNNPAGERLIDRHPSWVLRDAAGDELYIQFDCSGRSCTQYAADVGNPAWRSHWIAGAARTLAQGYSGIHIDDVNMAFRISNGAGTFTRPIDPRTGAPMTDADWRRYVTEFTEEIRAAFPDTEIVHNAIWFVDREHPEVARAVDAADYVELERGATDPGLTPGAGKYGFEGFLNHIDWLHSRGVGVILEPHGLDETNREFELAVYFLVGEGDDAIASDFEADPDNWWPGWETNLGAPEGERESWNGLLRRDFEDGIVLVNPPGAPTVEADLDGDYEDLDGNSVDNVSLAARQGLVLRRE